MEPKDYIGFTPDYIDRLLPNQVFVFGSNILGYHTGGASGTARKKFGAIWGQPEGLQGQSYAIPVDYGMGIRKDEEVRAAVHRFITFAKEHGDKFFLLTRIGCGTGGYRDDEIASFFKDALDLKNVCLPKSFVDALNGIVSFDLERFLHAQDSKWASYSEALSEIRKGQKCSHWIWYVFPQIKGLGHSRNSEFYGISSREEAKAYLDHSILGPRLREITQALLDCQNPSAYDILGFPDVLKVQSCMTLFDIIAPSDIFSDVLQKYYDGKRCEKTVKRIANREEKLNNQVRLSRLSITKDYTILLTDYEKELKMEPLVKAVYLLFLNHPEGISFKSLPSYKGELTKIYSRLRPFGLSNQAIKSIEDVTNPLLNSINEKCSRVRAAFLAEVDSSLVEQYCIIGKSGEEKKIMLPRDLVIWE